MKKNLRKNICNLDNYTSLSKVEDLSVCCKTQIGDALEYACLFWAKHLMGTPSSSHNVEEVHKTIDEFFTRHLLFWIEVLSLTRNLDVSIHIINDVLEWYTSVSCE